MKNPFRNFLLAWHRMRNTQVSTLDGVRLATGLDTPKLVRSLIFKRNYERDEAKLLRSAVQSGDQVLEIGAGIGFIGLLAARLAGQGRVTSYEANPAMQKVIETNCALNPVTPDLRMRAVTRDGRPLVFHQAENILSSSIVARSDVNTTEVKVKADAIGKVLDEISPDVVVVDVEGAEADLLPEVIDRAIPRLLVEFHPHIIGVETIEAIKASALAAGYEVVQESGDNVFFARATS